MRTGEFLAGSSQRSHFLGICAGIVLAVGIGLCSPVHGATITPGIPGGGIFELDGNAVQNFPGVSDDWSNILSSSPSPVGHIIATTICTDSKCDSNWPGVLADPPGVSIFVNGSKDLNDITNWVCRDQGAPDKDELLNAYAAAYNVGGDLVVFLGADRFDNSGTATMGFWLLQSSIVQPACLPAGNGKFLDSFGNPVNHTNGDILIVADFTNGGAIGTIRVFKWSSGTLTTIYDSQGSPAVDCTNGGFGDICGTINQSPIPSPWVYVPKGSSADSPFIRFGFMEVGVNLTHLFGSNSLVPCFSTFVAETRSSDTVSASQKDFVLGSFNVCSIGVSKVCTDNTPDLSGSTPQFTYDIGGCLTNTGFGSVTNFNITDSPAALFNLQFYRPTATDEAALIADPTKCTDFGTLGAMATSGTQINTSNTIAAGERIIWLAKFTSTSNGGTDTATATASSSGGGPTLTPATSSANCPKATFNPLISVTKVCTVGLAASNNDLVVESTISGVVCNKGDVPLNNVTVVDTTAGGAPGADMPNPILSITSLPAQSDPANPVCDPTLSTSAMSYNVTYHPSTVPTPAPGTTQRYVFTDDVTATGTPPAGLGLLPVTDTTNASCSLCPDCPPCTSPTSPTLKTKSPKK